jgi:ProP effector
MRAMTTDQTLCPPPAVNPAETPTQTHAATQAETPSRPSAQRAPKPGRQQDVQPVLEKLFSLYPHLFGAKFLPLKLGIFQELLAAHPEDFKRDALKAALGVHARSTRYLQCVAARKQRHDLLGNAVDDVAPEHVYLAILELFRRRRSRSAEDLGAMLRAQLVEAIEASGLSGADYLAKMQTIQAHEMMQPLEDALAEMREKQARQEALVKAYESSGKTPQDFAEMYGLPERDVQRALQAHTRTAASAPQVL